MYKTECLEEMEKRKADVLGTDIRAMKLGPLIYVPRVFVKSSQMGHKHRDCHGAHGDPGTRRRGDSFNTLMDKHKRRSLETNTQVRTWGLTK